MPEQDPAFHQMWVSGGNVTPHVDSLYVLNISDFSTPSGWLSSPVILTAKAFEKRSLWKTTE